MLAAPRTVMVKPLIKSAVISLLFLSLVACTGANRRVKYDDGGRERISILSSTETLDADDTIASLRIALPRPYKNLNWAQSGGNTRHSAQHLTIGENLSLAWRTSVGDGDRSYQRIISGPVAADGKVFSVDVDGDVTAVSLSDGRKLWDVELRSDERTRVGFGGGAAYYAGRLFVTSGYGFIAALDADNGSEIWRYEGNIPFRGAPTIGDNRLFAVTHDNQLITLNSEDGSLLWDQVGIVETAGMLGAASPAYDGNTVISALSSGELIAMRAANGRTVWQDALSSSRRLTPLATLADVDGSPVIDGTKVYAISHAGRMVAIDMRSGERSWEADIAGVNTPWIAGNFGFMTTIDGQIVCVTLGDGRIRWVTQLQRFEKQESRRGLIKWNGPILAGDRLLVTSSHGYALAVSPYTGDVIGGIKLPDGTNTAPIVVDDTFIILTDEGELLAYR